MMRLMPGDSRWSLLVTTMLALLLLWRTVSSPMHVCLHWDSTGYYFYLPALFIYDDIELTNRSWLDDLRSQYELSGTLYQMHPVPGREGHVDQFSCGVAIILAPAFFLAHALAEPLGYKADGFSAIYQLTAAWWSFLLALAGMIALLHLLRRFFSDGTTAIVLVLLLGGTNYLVQVPGNLVSPHNYLFLMMALYLLVVDNWRRSGRSYFFYIAIALAAGAALIRPTELIWLWILPTWGSTSLRQAWGQFRELLIFRQALVLRALGIGLLVVSPQVIYWLVSTGRPFYMSYSNPGEGLDLLQPHTLDFLFSFRKGWFIYTPLALVAVLGFIPLLHRRPEWRIAVTGLFLINLYVVSSWTTWWYAQCFSQRVMIHSFPLLALPLACAIDAVRGWTRWRLPAMAGIAGLFLLSVFYQWQYTQRILHGDRMTAAYFFRIWGKTEVTDEDMELLLIERPFDGSMSFRNKERYSLVRDEDLSLRVDESWQSDSAGVPEFLLHAESAFSPVIRRPFSELTTRDHAWILADAEVRVPAGVRREDVLLITTAEYNGRVYGYTSWEAATDSAGIWKFHAEYLTPEVRTKKDPVTVYIWYRGQDTVAVHGIRTRVFVRDAAP
ncbi:MAG: hypothetical protein ACK5XV_03720 [Flavobacteriales bacterium]